MSTTPLLVLCTCPDRDTALGLAEALVATGLAACVSLVEGITSVYAWEGRTEQAAECQLLAKTTAARYPALEQAILARHPYELPEILAVPVERGLPGYLQWIESCTTSGH